MKDLRINYFMLRIYSNIENLTSAPAEDPAVEAQRKLAGKKNKIFKTIDSVVNNHAKSWNGPTEMAFRKRWTNLLYSIATGTKKTRTLLTPIGGILALGLSWGILQVLRMVVQKGWTACRDKTHCA